MKYSFGADTVVSPDNLTWIAPNAIVIGKVELKENSSVWWGCVIRGDNEQIVIGENSNIQDGCILHTDPGYPLDIGPNVTVGHMVSLHGCRIAGQSLIGIGSTILNGAIVGRNCIIGARTLITEGKEIPDNSMVLGMPGKVIRETRPSEVEKIMSSSQTYVERWKKYEIDLHEQE